MKMKQCMKWHNYPTQCYILDLWQNTYLKKHMVPGFFVHIAFVVHESH